MACKPPCSIRVLPWPIICAVWWLQYELIMDHAVTGSRRADICCPWSKPEHFVKVTNRAFQFGLWPLSSFYVTGSLKSSAEFLLGSHYTHLKSRMRDTWGAKTEDKMWGALRQSVCPGSQKVSKIRAILILLLHGFTTKSSDDYMTKR